MKKIIIIILLLSLHLLFSSIGNAKMAGRNFHLDNCGTAEDQKPGGTKWVTIGNQVWTSENLNVDKFRNGDAIPEIQTIDAWLKAYRDGKPGWCYYNFDTANGIRYGKLYNWHAVNDPRGLAPEGWRIPSNADWDELIEKLGGNDVAAAKMKSAQGWQGTGNGNNQSGFKGLPGGICRPNSSFNSIGMFGYWWSSSQYLAANAWDRILYYNNTVIRSNHHKASGLSVRCIKEGDAATLPYKEFLFGDDQPYPECHASTLLQLKDGKYLAAWFGGTKEKHDDVGIWMTKGTPGNWGKTIEVAKIRNDAHWNPVLFKAPGGKIFLYFKVGKQIPGWTTWVKTSDDEGESWSEATELVKGDTTGGRGPVRCKPIILSNGTWLAGASHEKGLWNTFIDRSEDHGKTWQPTPYIQLNREEITGKGIIQPTLWESSPGIVHALIRSTASIIYRSDSKDYGKTWSPVYKTSLPNPNSGIDVVRLPDGTLLLAYNPTGANWGSRGKLALAISFDNGTTWPKKLELENANIKDEFSYPAIINVGDTVSLTYTWNRKKIVFWKATKDWILSNAEEMN
jgi:uncharacterized protein (TIGR02145 family)